jgi:putative hemolysin
VVSSLLIPVSLLVVLALALALDLATAAARAAVRVSSYARLLSLRDEYGERANRVIPLFHSNARLLSSLNLVLALTRFLLAGLACWLLFYQFPSLPWQAAFAGLTGAALVLALFESAASALASRQPELSVIRLGWLIRSLKFVTTPLVALLQTFSPKAGQQAEAAGMVTEDELMTMVDAGEQDGAIEQDERRMIYSVIELGNTLAREIMVPRIDMLALDAQTPLSEAVDILLTSGHSRVPVYADTVDHTLGLLYAKDLLRVWREGSQIGSLHSLLRTAYYVPEAKKVDELLAEMQSQRIHMAMVVDEYGGIAGLVTLEDIVEEILGEIRDEYDQAEELPYQVVKNGDTIFLGRIDLDDFNEVMGSHLPKEDADTLGGYIYGQLGRVPVLGETVRCGNLSLSVEQVSARRIHKVRARWAAEKEQGQTEVEHNVDG